MHKIPVLEMLWPLCALTLERLVSLRGLSYDLLCLFELLSDLFAIVELLRNNSI